MDTEGDLKAAVLTRAFFVGYLGAARALLDAEVNNPALRKAFAKELTLLATSAGVPLNHPDVNGHGKRLRDAANDSVVTVDDVADEAPRSGSLLSRLRSRAA